MAYIYKITNLINGKIYVGKSEREDSYHRKNYFGSGVVIRLAIKKYGKENFKKEFLEENVDLAKIDEREQFWISKLDAMNESIGYNRAYGGEGGCTKEAAAKGLQTRRQNGYFHHSEETRYKISIASKGKKKSAIHKQHLSDHHRLKTTHIVFFENGEYYCTRDSIVTIAKKYGITGVMLKRASEVYDFRRGLILLDLVKCEEAFDHIYANISSKDLVFTNPLTNKPCSPTSWRIFREYNMELCKEFPKHPYNKEFQKKKIDFCNNIKSKITKILEEVPHEIQSDC